MSRSLMVDLNDIVGVKDVVRRLPELLRRLELTNPHRSRHLVVTRRNLPVAVLVHSDVYVEMSRDGVELGLLRRDLQNELRKANGLADQSQSHVLLANVVEALLKVSDRRLGND